MELQQHHFTIEHRPGKANNNADALSRMYNQTDEVQCLMVNAEYYEEEIASPDYQHRPKKMRIEKRACTPPPQSPLLYECCQQIICECETSDHDDWDAYQRAWEDSIYEENWDTSYNLGNDPMEGDEIVTRTYTYTKEDLRELYKGSIKLKEIIAGQPLMKGGSRCTDACDIENYHTHTYCTTCKRNLFQDTIVHDCNFGFGCGDIHPEMNPRFLVNIPWWKEPLAVQNHNNYIYLRYLQSLLSGLSFYYQDVDTSEIIGELD